MLKTKYYLLAPTVFILLFVLTFCNLKTATANEPVPYGGVSSLDGKLVFAHVIYRHGDRTVIEPYPNDPWKDAKYWPIGWGQLTNLGKQQHYQLGQWLKKRYESLLSEKYNKDEIYIQSTDVDRTLMSALSNLAGMYEPKTDQIWNENIKWQPIPVHTSPEKFDAILAGKAPCPAFDYALSELLNSIEFQKVYEHFKYLFDYLTEKSGANINSLEAVQRINNTFFIENLKNRTLPDWTKKVYPSEDMSYLTNLAFSVSSYTRQMARLKVGPLIKDILERFDKKARGKLDPNRSVWVYSAHDTTVANVLNSLKMFDLHSPPYAACIMFEMRLDTENKPYVSIFYKNTTAEPKPMIIPNCGTACPLEKMYSLYNDILPVDWKHECQLSTMMMTYEEANIGQATAILIVIITIMLFLSFIVMVYYRRRSYRLYSAYSQMA